MGEFKLDTSGFILMPRGPHWDGVNWSDLDPFTQGYVRKLFESLYARYGTPSIGKPSIWSPKFSDLSPEALAMILRDCENALNADYTPTAENGAAMWNTRQNNGLAMFPPLTITLADDGKIHLN